MTTIRTLLADSHFQQKKVLEKLVCHYMHITKEQIFTSYEMEIPQEQLTAIKTGYDAYVIDKKPLEFILGFVEFYQRRFAVDGRCLIPRPETEYMIEGVCDHVTAQLQAPHGDTPQAKTLLVDVGTGCGVLGLSVLLENPTYFSRAYLTEYFPDTLSLAQENYNHYKDQIPTHTQLVQADLIDFLVTPTAPASATAPAGTTTDADIIIVANLPYIPDETFDTSAEDNVKKREPRPAFVGGTDGLDYYRQMFTQIFSLQTSDQKANSITMFLEMMTRQVDILRQEFGDKIDFSEIKTFHFNIRIVKGLVR